jgi:uncharacterized protein (UPF0332 family)
MKKAREFLLKARDMLADDWPDEAGRAAYLAGLHAAQAVIVERTGRVIKRHRGVHNESRRLTRDEPGFDRRLRTFLGRAYNLKAITDYGTEPDSGVTIPQADAIATAGEFVEVAAALLVERDGTG